MRRSEAFWIESTKRWMIKVQKDGIRKSFYSSKPSKAGKIEAEKQADKWLEAGECGDMRFGQLWQEFLERCEITTGTANYEKHKSIGRNWLIPLLEHKRISKITPLMLQTCIDVAYKNGLSKKSCTNIRSSIVAVAKFARLKQLPPLNITELTIPINAPIKEKNILQPDALKILFTDGNYKFRGKVLPAFYIHAWRFLVITGLRRGELCGLRNEDIRDNYLTIKRSINRFQEITTGKNKNARRSFLLPNRAVEILNAQKEHLKSLGIISPWIFPAMDGQPLNSNILYESWKRYCKYHNIECTVHELRHTMISYAQTEMPNALLKRLVGHSASMDTNKIYGHEHEVDGDDIKTSQYLDSVFDRFLNSNN